MLFVVMALSCYRLLFSGLFELQFCMIIDLTVLRHHVISLLHVEATLASVLHQDLHFLGAAQ